MDREDDAVAHDDNDDDEDSDGMLLAGRNT